MTNAASAAASGANPNRRFCGAGAAGVKTFAQAMSAAPSA